MIRNYLQTKGKEMKVIGIAEQFFVLFGNEQNERPHRHYGIQLLIPTNTLAINRYQTDASAIIDSHVEHVVYGDGNILSLLFNPETTIGRRISNHHFQNKKSAYEGIVYFHNPHLTTNAKAMTRTIDGSAPNNAAINELIYSTVEQLLRGVPPLRQLDDRVSDVIQYIESSDFTHLRYEDAVNSVFLSKSRVTHLFTEEMGISLMKYMTWKRLLHASKEIALSGKSITEAAHLYGFADAAHFSRVFKENFGVSPSGVFQKQQKNDRLIHVFTRDFS
ncbi:helix-turn-helix transcriptional regulator [Numidum massiliense]|uniref:helix-turn-helix transcriptional regulator n=1 Tax=Numidum massiliense TaxID=1522315 RepID=UPI0011C7A19C|nr:helix-turn-helix transcriptional regulator [Numidum massiliense]